MIPCLRDRPLTFVRCPRGIAKKRFYNKHFPDHFPDFVERINVPEKEETIVMAAAGGGAEFDTVKPCAEALCRRVLEKAA